MTANDLSRIRGLYRILCDRLVSSSSRDFLARVSERYIGGDIGGGAGDSETGLHDTHIQVDR